ncbi:MAG: hypothetical protein J0653_08135 [Deltaproteobacteria bacterium]|nr:hypothetical protein [Deltaproteobacteria bacterium]
MSGSSLPRKLTAIVNKLANARANARALGETSMEKYRENFKQAKAAILAQVVTWLAQGKSVEDVIKRLSNSGENRRLKLMAAIKAATKQIMEMP